MYREEWRATVLGGHKRVGHDSTTKQQQNCVVVTTLYELFSLTAWERSQHRTKVGK